MLATLSESVPLPDLVNPPRPLIPIVETVVLPAPEIVRRFPALVTPPVRVKVPASDAIVAAPVSVIAPESVLLPEIFLNAPSEEIPEPAISKISPTVMLLEICRAAPETTVVLPSVEPNAEELEI